MSVHHRSVVSAAHDGRIVSSTSANSAPYFFRTSGGVLSGLERGEDGLGRPGLEELPVCEPGGEPSEEGQQRL